MSGFQSPITVYDAMRHIEEKSYLLPAFQREFVWSSDQIERLFDSLMRDYPIGSMLFWKVDMQTVTNFNFYLFLDKFIQNYRTMNDRQMTISKDFMAILDGQQRLTALHIGLYGSYAYHEYYKPWEYSPVSFPERLLYLCISKTGSDEENDKKYFFSFEKAAVTKGKDLYEFDGGLWFRVGKIIDLHNNFGIDDFCDEHSIPRDSKKMLLLLERKVFTDFTINYYEEVDQNPDKAVSIFTRINSGGTNLSPADIMFSLVVSNWKKDAKGEMKGVVERVNSKGFKIDNGFILKAILVLYHKSVKFAVNSFSKGFCLRVEDRWEDIRDSIEVSFDLMRLYGLSDQNLTSKNAVLPILYYLYHTGKYRNFTTSVSYTEDRNAIKKWLFSVLLRRAFGAQTDSTLTAARKAFTDDIEKEFIADQSHFPSERINENIKGRLSAVDDDFISDLLATQKDSSSCFTILSLLYPNLDYKNNNFHKDHLHPEKHYEKLPDDVKTKHSFADYNSIVNLEMLDANENESKQEKSLIQWVDSMTGTASSRKQFLASHLIPDVDLSLENFNQFYDERKRLLSEKLKVILQ